MEEQQIRAFSSELIIGILLVILGLIILFNQPLFISINTTANNITAVDNAIPGFAIKNIATNNNNIDIIIDR